MVKLLPPRCAASLVKLPDLRNEHCVLTLWYYQMMLRVKNAESWNAGNPTSKMRVFSFCLMPLSGFSRDFGAILAARRNLR